MALILFLHGASSSGKSTLASAIRAIAKMPLLHLSIDHLRDSGAWDVASYPDWSASRSSFFSGFHHALAAFANTGNNLLVEHILDTPGWHSELKELFQEHDVLFVGLHTALEVLNLREDARGDRPKGSAAQDYHSVHSGFSYDLTLDGDAPARENAALVMGALSIPRDCSRFFAT